MNRKEKWPNPINIMEIYLFVFCCVKNVFLKSDFVSCCKRITMWYSPVNIPTSLKSMKEILKHNCKT